MEVSNPVDLIRLNLSLEYRIASDGLLVPFPGSSEQARVTLHRHAGGYLLFFRHYLPVALRERIAALPPEQTLYDHSRVKRILAEHAPGKRMWLGKGYYFARQPLPTDFPDVVMRNDRYVVIQEGEPVAQAWTVRQNDRAAEVAVETKPTFRHRGYAR